MPSLPVPSLPVPRPRRPIRTTRASGRPHRTRIVVVGDLALDVVVAPDRPLVAGSDVPGGVSLRQGGSAATTARVASLLGARATLVTAVGRDPVGRALIAELRRAGVTVHAVRVPRLRTARIGVVVDGRERAFVADRGAADALGPEALRPPWFAGCDGIHVPAYSLLAEPLGAASRHAVGLARGAGAALSLDLASAAPLLARGRRAALRLVRELGPDLVFGTDAEAAAILGGSDVAALLDLAPVVAIKRGSAGSTILARRADASAPIVRFDVATRPLPAGDPTGGGDAFDAGFLVSWLAASPAERRSVAALRRAAVAGNLAAARFLGGPRLELAFP